MKRLLALILIFGGIGVAQDATLYIANDSSHHICPLCILHFAPSNATRVR
jgi:hypothetical protein